MKRAAALVLGIGLIIAGVTFVKGSPEPSGSRLVVGSLADFPVGSITPLDLQVKLAGYVPRVSETARSTEAEVPVFIVNDPDQGFVALYASDPHLGCRVGLASQLPADAGFALSAEVVFLNPCHGEQYDGLGRYLAGPSPRGLDRFGVVVEGEDVIVDVAAFEYGPER